MVFLATLTTDKKSGKNGIWNFKQSSTGLMAKAKNGILLPITHGSKIISMLEIQKSHNKVRKRGKNQI